MGKKRWIGNILFRDLARKQGILATGRRERRTRGGGWVASERVFQLCFIPTFVDNHSPRDIRGYFPPSLSRAIEKDGKGSKVALVPPLMELHRWWLYTDTKPVALPARGNPMPRNRSSPSLFPGRSIRFKKKKIGILASIWFEEHTLASRKKKGRRVIIFIAVLERQRCKRASFKSNLARLPFKLPFV